MAEKYTALLTVQNSVEVLHIFYVTGKTSPVLKINVKKLNSLKLGVRTAWWTRTTKTAKIF